MNNASRKTSIHQVHGSCELFSNLSERHLLELEAAGSVRIYHLDAEERIELRGGTHDQVVYLLHGAAEVESRARAGDAAGAAVESIASGCRSLDLPHGGMVVVRAAEPLLLCRVNRSELDYVTAWTGLRDCTRHGSDDFREFLDRLRHPAVFRHLPLENVEEAYKQMARREVASGDVIMNQGDVADDFYVIETGTAEVWQQELYDEQPQKVAELGPGDHFGSDALITGGRRDATVRISAGGALLVLGGEQFVALIERPLVHVVEPPVALAMIEAGEREVLDVRYEEEWEESHLPNVTLLPLFQLRQRLGELDPARPYLTCCRSGNRSAVAAMILNQSGFDALSLKGGVRDWPYETESRE